MGALTIASPTAYNAAFDTERKSEYPVVDAFEERCGYAVDRARLEGAARVLACPLKANAPNWQHGRVLYAAARKYFDGKREYQTVLDIGTAKGFSALCLLWALNDAQAPGEVTSVDVIDPLSRVVRNTIAECDGLLTLAETLRPWPEAIDIVFRQSTGVAFLLSHQARIHVAFIDGKHSGPVVLKEGRLIADRQKKGDLVIFDDVHIPDVSVAVNSFHAHEYSIQHLQVLPNRAYAIGVRR